MLEITELTEVTEPLMIVSVLICSVTMVGEDSAGYAPASGNE